MSNLKKGNSEPIHISKILPKILSDIFQRVKDVENKSKGLDSNQEII